MFRQTVVLTLLGHLPAAFSSLLLLKVPGGPVLPQDASHYLHPSLASFSIETAFFEEFLGTASAPSDLSWWLFNNLHTRTLVPPEIRIGGITADSTYYNPNASTSLSNFIDQAGVLHNTTIGPGFWDSVNLLPEGSKITMNLVSHRRRPFLTSHMITEESVESPRSQLSWCPVIRSWVIRGLARTLRPV